MVRDLGSVDDNHPLMGDSVLTLEQLSKLFYKSQDELLDSIGRTSRPYVSINFGDITQKYYVDRTYNPPRLVFFQRE